MMTDLLDVEQIAARRAAAGLTQVQAAKAAGFTPQRWNDIEAGRKLNIELDTLARLAKALKCDPCDLLKKPKAARG